MAGVIGQHEDLKNGRVFSMWCEDGIQYRSNILLWVGATIPLHRHSYDHTARIKGRMKMTVDGVESIVEHGSKVFIPAGKQHTFELLELFNGVGEVLCFWSLT